MMLSDMQCIFTMKIFPIAFQALTKIYFFLRKKKNRKKCPMSQSILGRFAVATILQSIPSTL